MLKKDTFKNDAFKNDAFKMFCSGIAALAVLSGVMYFVENRLGVLLFPLTWQNITFVSAVVLISGLLITLFASLIATGRYIRMDNNSLYEI